MGILCHIRIPAFPGVYDISQRLCFDAAISSRETDLGSLEISCNSRKNPALSLRLVTLVLHILNDSCCSGFKVEFVLIIYCLDRFK